MAKTPEGVVKAAIDKILKEAPFCYSTKPVVGPYGATMLDYVGCSKGRYFEIEAKRSDVPEPSERQAERMRLVVAAGGTAFFINGSEGQLDALRDWLHAE